MGAINHDPYSLTTYTVSRVLFQRVRILCFMSNDPQQLADAPTENPEINLLEWLSKNQPEITKLVECFAENYVKYRKSLLDAEQTLYEKKLELQKTVVRDRQSLSTLFIVAVLFIFIITAVLTAIGKFDGNTLTFLLGTSVGSLLTILGKVFAPNGQ